MLLGTAGWRPPGFAYDTASIFGTHATEKNPRYSEGSVAVLQGLSTDLGWRELAEAYRLDTERPGSTWGHCEEL